MCVMRVILVNLVHISLSIVCYYTAFIDIQSHIAPYSVHRFSSNLCFLPLSHNYTYSTSLSPDKLKDAIIAKIAMQAADLYADAYSNMQVGSVKQMWDKVGVLVLGHVTLV